MHKLKSSQWNIYQQHQKQNYTTYIFYPRIHCTVWHPYDPHLLIYYRQLCYRTMDKCYYHATLLFFSRVVLPSLSLGRCPSIPYLACVSLLFTLLCVWNVASHTHNTVVTTNSALMNRSTILAATLTDWLDVNGPQFEQIRNQSVLLAKSMLLQSRPRGYNYCTIIHVS